MAYGGGGDSGAAEQRALEIQRQSKIAQGMANIDEQFGRFDDEFYNRRAGEVEQYHLPELNRQATETRNSLAYSLARSGLTRSGVAEDKYGSLDREKATQERNVADAGQASANQLRQDVEGQRTALVNQVQASADPNLAAQAATRTAAAYQTPQSLQPIGNFFEGWSRNYLNNQVARAYDPNVAPLFPSWGGQQEQSSQRVVNGG
jgi:hypothetical protein